MCDDLVQRVHARLPNDVGLLCDYYERPWPAAWADNFWRFKFFYVAGFKQYLEDLGIVDNQPRMNEMFSHFRHTAQEMVADAWFGQLYGVEQSSIDVEALKERQHLKVLIMDRLLETSRSEPVAFSQALLTTVALAARMELDGDDRDISDVVQIRCAAHYLPDFGALYPDMTYEERIRLREETAQTIPRLFDEVADGFPITHALALAVENFVINQTEVGTELSRLPISTYETRRDINKIAGPNSESVGNGGNMRVAQPERTFRGKPGVIPADKSP